MGDFYTSAIRKTGDSMTIEIRRLTKASEIASLAAYRDDSPDPLMLCDYGQFVQWMADVMPGNLNTMAVFAAYEGPRIVGYIAVLICRFPPLYCYGTVLRLSCHEPDGLRPLGAAALDWGREKGVTRVSVSVYDERARDLYARVFGFAACGWQLSREVQPCLPS